MDKEKFKFTAGIVSTVVLGAFASIYINKSLEGNNFPIDIILLIFSVIILFAVVYFFLTDLLMKK